MAGYMVNFTLFSRLTVSSRRSFVIAVIGTYGTILGELSEFLKKLGGGGSVFTGTATVRGLHSQSKAARRYTRLTT